MPGITCVYGYKVLLNVTTNLTQICFWTKQKNWNWLSQEYAAHAASS